MKVKTITLPIGTCVIDLNEDMPGAGRIGTDWRGGEIVPSRVAAAIDAIESIVLAHACAGVDVESPEYIEGIQTALDAIENNL